MDSRLALNLCYLGFTLALIAIAIYSQVTANNFDLPIGTGITLLTIFLPLIALANAAYTPRLFRLLQRYNSPSLQYFLPAGLQLSQAILTVILATLTFQGFLPSQTLNCSLQGNWQQLWSAHDGRAIGHIQDALNCCGFHTVKHEAWPPEGQCSQLYKRYTPCEGPWTAVMQRTSGLDFAVVVAVGILQIIQLVRFRMQGQQQDSFSSEGRRRLMHGSRSADPATEGLLENGSIEEDDADRQQDSREYGCASEETNNNPRIHPSNLGDDHPHWG